MHRAEFLSAVSPIMTMPHFALILEITPLKLISCVPHLYSTGTPRYGSGTLRSGSDSKSKATPKSVPKLTPRSGAGFQLRCVLKPNSPLFEPTCAHARWALMRLSVRLSVCPTDKATPKAVPKLTPRSGAGFQLR